MRRPIVALLALIPLASAVTPAPAAPTKTPTAKVVFRPECFSMGGEDIGGFYPAPTQQLGGAAGAKPTGSARTNRGPIPSVTPSAPPAPPMDLVEEAAMPEAEPAVAPSKSPSPGRAASTKSKGSKKAPAAAEGDFGAMPVPATEYEDAKETKSREKTVDESAASLDDLAASPREDRTVTVGDTVRRQVERVLDWGATVYLSNDDSMSLASAQRLLYAAMNHVPFTVQQIRPHELLNYFSFDTVTPDADQLFDVLASAEQDGDKLSVALAVKGASPVRQPLDLTVVVDRSCSMADEGRMDYTKRGLTLMADQLDKGDRIDVVLFDDRVCTPLENFVVGRDDPSLLEQTIRYMQPEGSTDVGLGLRTAYDVQKRHSETQGRNRRVMILTDALMNTGDVDPNTVSEIGHAYDADKIRLTGIGVGREFNDEALDKLTEKGKGSYVFLGSEAVVDRVFGPNGFDQLVQTIAHDVHFALKLPKSLAMERFYGEEASTVKEEVQPIHYASGTSQLFLQDLVVKGGAPVKTDPVELEITYRNAASGEPETRTFRTTVGAMLKADPHNVRKGLALMAWTDLLTEEAMGGDPCGAVLSKYASRASKLPEDAEIGFVNGLVQDRCGAFELSRVVTAAGGVPFKVRVDADIPISTVALSCGAQRSTESLSGSDVIAMFTAPPGVCELTLSGTVDMIAKVEVPQTGGDLRCIIRGGRVSCS